MYSTPTRPPRLAAKDTDTFTQETKTRTERRVTVPLTFLRWAETQLFHNTTECVNRQLFAVMLIILIVKGTICQCRVCCMGLMSMHLFSILFTRIAQSCCHRHENVSLEIKWTSVGGKLWHSFSMQKNCLFPHLLPAPRLTSLFWQTYLYFLLKRVMVSRDSLNCT